MTKITLEIKTSYTWTNIVSASTPVLSFDWNYMYKQERVLAFVFADLAETIYIYWPSHLGKTNYIADIKEASKLIALPKTVELNFKK